MAKQTSKASAGKPDDTQQQQQQPAAGEQTAPANPDAPPATLGLNDAALSEALHGDDEPPLAPSPQPPIPELRGRQGDDRKPYCPRHNVLMRATGSTRAATHYGCPVAGCTTREKRARPQVKVPAEPMLCQQRTCKDKKGQAQVALEVDDRLSNLAQLQMVCPSCGCHLKVPRPQFDLAAVERERRREAQDLAAR